MSTGAKVIIAVAVVGLLTVAAMLSLSQRQERGAEVRMEDVSTRDLYSVVTASGNIRPRRTVDISSDISARVESVEIEEGEDVEQGQVLMRLDPSEYEAARSRAEAGLRQQNAQASTQEANLTQARRAYDRLLSISLNDSTLVSAQQLQDAETQFQIASANVESARFGVEQAQASLDEAEDRLSKTIITAPMSGRVTRLNVEEGETVVIGTMNNPGSLILTVSDLSTVEVVVQVDETDVPLLDVGDSADVRIDAFPDVDFSGRVTEIGNSAIVAPTGSQQSAIDFEVVVTLDPSSVPLRPDLSATADIVTEARVDAVAIPIIALTVREMEDDAVGSFPDSEADGEELEEDEVEGVFVVEDGIAHFRAVSVGVTGAEFFEVLEGVDVGETVVAGPYQVVRQLRDGDPVRSEDGPDSEEPSPAGR